MGVDIPTDKIASNVFDNFKKITPGLLAVALLSGALLFLPQSVLAKIKLAMLLTFSALECGLTKSPAMIERLK